MKKIYFGENLDFKKKVLFLHRFFDFLSIKHEENGLAVPAKIQPETKTATFRELKRIFNS